MEGMANITLETLNQNLTILQKQEKNMTPQH